MTQQQYDIIIEHLTHDRKQVSEAKRKDYTKGSQNVLKNFYNQSEELGITPLQSLGVHMEKQFSAILNYIKTDGQSESEPIIKRIGDAMNYLELMWGVINEEEKEVIEEFTIDSGGAGSFSMDWDDHFWDEDDDSFLKEDQYIVGDIVKITDNFTDHEFPIGENVILKKDNIKNWMAIDKNGNEWFIKEDEFEKTR